MPYLRVEGAAYGPSVMKFTLTYDGELRANGRPPHKWAIRQQLSPQLRELWKVSPALLELKEQRMVPLHGSYGVVLRHHTVPPVQQTAHLSSPETWIDVLAPIVIGNKTFIPLVRDTLSLHCALKILFLRKEEPGKLIFQGGDIDNRLKTLFDALSIPNLDQLVDDPTGNEPTYCLLQNDRSISAVAIETQRMLSNPIANKHDVRLVIEVDVRVSASRPYNHGFLGE